MVLLGLVLVGLVAPALASEDSTASSAAEIPPSARAVDPGPVTTSGASAVAMGTANAASLEGVPRRVAPAPKSSVAPSELKESGQDSVAVLPELVEIEAPSASDSATEGDKEE